ncbi:FRG domain-containing protein [Idiomarina abyssalis]|uniref:FRG domain-containing protein n=1 Tax=Idiomarina abyssalis TaxID=86102 RepID=UPI001C97B4FA|nr:FRG domain-containing protein [Idiomarina abyssalis]QZN90449.1 FRG domain-containing protein [Idiomarina abyssalis]
MERNMVGQWIGRYQGSADGRLMINIDQVGSHLEGVAYVMPDDRNLPSSVGRFATKSTGNEHVSEAFINPVDPRSGFQCQWDDIKHLYSDQVHHSSEAKISLKLENEKLIVVANSSEGFYWESTLSRPISNSQSKVTSTVKSWKDFKDYLSGFSKSKYLFRGQREPWRLRTSFHRKGRYRISEFTSKDVKQLHKRLSAITKHYFNLEVPDQNGSFFNLLQHHGYPTPLLDWSYSPFVSAFFAFRDLPQNYDGDGYVRIYIFNSEAWINNYTQIQNLDPPCPHLSVMEFIAIDNPRLVPQQAVTTVTNIDDIEAYLLEKAKDDKVAYIQAIDIPANEREHVMRDLRFMGITAGSMFPSIDGVCEELRETNF